VAWMLKSGRGRLLDKADLHGQFLQASE
jgi:hypothetical protein